MAALRPGVIATIVRKDVLSLWPLMLASLLLPLYAATEPLLKLSPQVTTLLVGIGILATMVLTLTVIHQDATAGGRHDWMTRPIGMASLTAAKATFLGLAVIAPLFLATVVNEIAAGHGWSEALLYGLSFLSIALYVAVPVFVLGLVTGSLIQAGVIGLGLVILQILVAILFPRTGSDPGSRWIIDLLAGAVGLAFCVAAVAVLYRTKRSEVARLIWLAGAVAVAAILTFVPARATIAMQQALFPGADVTGPLTTSVVEACFDPIRLTQAPRLHGLLRGRIVAGNLPQGWAIKIDNASVSYPMKDGGTIHGPDAYAANFDGVRFPRAVAPFLLRTGELRVSNLAPQVTDVQAIQWNYDISLLAPGAPRNLPIDGRRRYLPGVGFCDATRQPGGEAVEVSCFKPFAQPATIGVRAAGAPEDGCSGCGGATYRPAVLDGFGKSRRMWISENMRRVQTVTVTPYESRGHVARRSTTTGAPALCPKPPGAAS